ncbi:MAG: methyltransferase [Candidatus Omnitrophica bacterium]|nr:methyltransferase [Candidatus Omnitrophota bacterium]
MTLPQRIKKSLIRKLLPIPFESRHAEYSAISCADDADSQASDRLFNIALQSIEAAKKISLDSLAGRRDCNPELLNLWPGEHYRLLAGITRVLQPKCVVEIGTASGISALAMKQTLPKGARIVTFDIIPWALAPEISLEKKDFEDGSLLQYTDDLTQPEDFAKHQELLAQADLIFLDAAKDGVMEQRFLDLMGTLTPKTQPLLVLDDIRVWNMLRIWKDIRRPKLDLSSFGHWTGTGLVDWS